MHAPRFLALTLLLLPMATAIGVDFERPDTLETVFNPPDLTPRFCAGPAGNELFIPAQYVHVDHVPVILLTGATSGTFRVSWGDIPTPDHAAVWVEGTAVMDTGSEGTCGLPAEPDLGGIKVRIMGILETRAPGTYEAVLDGQRVDVTTAAGTESFPIGKRYHWIDDVGDWNFGPYLHETTLSVTADTTTPNCLEYIDGCGIALSKVV